MSMNNTKNFKEVMETIKKGDIWDSIDEIGYSGLSIVCTPDKGNIIVTNKNGDRNSRIIIPANLKFVLSDKICEKYKCIFNNSGNCNYTGSIFLTKPDENEKCEVEEDLY